MKHSLFPIVAVAVGLGLAGAGPAAGAAGDCVISGDANADGRFDIDDLLLLMDWLDGAPPEPPLPGTPVFLASDVNKDSLIDWNDFFLYLDKLNGVIAEFPYPNTCTFPFAGYDWLTFDLSTYTVPSTYIPKSPDDVAHSTTEVGINSHDEYVFRGVKTSASLAENTVVYTLEFWQTEAFHWQSYPFSAMLPFVSLHYFNWDRMWSLDTVTPEGTSTRLSFNLTPGGAQLNDHYFARLAYYPATHTLVFSFKKNDGAYTEIYRGTTYWGRVGMEALGESATNGNRVRKIFLLSSDGHGTAHYRLSLDCQGAGCPPNGGDQTPPVVSPSVSGVAGANGWYTSTVTLSWNLSDPETGIASSNGCGTVNVVENTQGVTYTCAATNGAGLSTSVPVSLRVDKDPPVVTPTVTGTLGPNGWYVSDVSVTWAVTDATSGVGGTSGCSAVVLKTNTPGTTLVCTGTNGAGMATSGTVTVKIDKSPGAIVTALVSFVNGLAGVEAGTKNSLTAKLESALGSLARGNGNAAKNQLQAFINEVQAQRGKALSTAEANFLILQAVNAQAGIG